MMHPDLTALLAELEVFGRTNDDAQADRANRMLNLEPDTAHLISLLIRLSGRRQVLEIGTSNGYSTIWLAWAVGVLGHVTSLDRSAEKHTLAEQNIKRSGLQDRVELITGDATAIVEKLTGPFDTVFFDADRTSAPAQLQILLPKLAPGTLLLADNVLSHPEEIAGYLDALAAIPHLDTMVISVGKGLSIAYYEGRASSPAN
jgi:predicted O-methyltransferase YrrM